MGESSEAPDAPATPVSSTNIEALQALKAQEGTQAAKEQALRQLLGVLDPHPQDAQLTYRQVLERLDTVLARELQAPGD